jgi:hypothetical protein
MSKLCHEVGIGDMLVVPPELENEISGRREVGSEAENLVGGIPTGWGFEERHRDLPFRTNGRRSDLHSSSQSRPGIGRD